MEHNDLSKKLHNLTLEVSSMKKVMVNNYEFENQFIKLKQQLAEIIDEITNMKSSVAIVQMTIKNEKDSPAQVLHCTSPMQSNTSNCHSVLALDEQVKGQWLTIGIMKEHFSKLQQDLTAQSLEFTKQSKSLQTVIEQQKYMEGKMNLLLAKMDQDSQEQLKINNKFAKNLRDCLKALKHTEKKSKSNRTLSRVRKLEHKVAVSLKNGRSLIKDIVEKRIQFLTESVEDNAYDIHQCWKMIEELQEADKYFMLNGEKVQLEEEINRLIFGQESLLAQSEEQMTSMAKIQDDINGKSISEIFGWKFSHKDLLDSLKDIGEKYEMMRVLVLQRVEGLERSKKFLATLNVMAKSRQELGKQVDLLKQDIDFIKESIKTQNMKKDIKWLNNDQLDTSENTSFKSSLSSSSSTNILTPTDAPGLSSSRFQLQTPATTTTTTSYHPLGSSSNSWLPVLPSAFSQIKTISKSISRVTNRGRSNQQRNRSTSPKPFIKSDLFTNN